MVAIGVQSFYTLEGATGLLIELWPKFFHKFNPDMWWTNAENFKPISLLVPDLLLFNWKILAIVGLRLAENGKRRLFSAKRRPTIDRFELKNWLWKLKIQKWQLWLKYAYKTSKNPFEGVHWDAKNYWNSLASLWNFIKVTTLKRIL